MADTPALIVETSDNRLFRVRESVTLQQIGATTIATTPEAARTLAAALFGGRRAAEAGLHAARRALTHAREQLPIIRSLRHLTGNSLDDWCRGERRYRESRACALERVARCRAGVARSEAELAAVIAEDAEIAADVARAEARWSAQERARGLTVPPVTDRRAA